MSQLFNVVFAGEIVAGADLSTVKANVGRLFKVDDAMLGKLFSGQRVALKKNVDQAVAMKMRAAMKQAGAIVHLVAVDPAAAAEASATRPAPAVPSPAVSSPAAAPVAASVAAPLPPAAPPKPAAPVPTATPVPSAPMTMAQRIAALSAQQDASDAAAKVAASTAAAGGGAAMKMLPTGARLSDESREPEPAAPDISGMSMARPGTDLVKEEELARLRPAPVPMPDLAAINLAPSGGDLLKPEERPVSVPVVVDVSAMSVAPPETEVLKSDERPVVVPVEVDISALSMAPPGAPLDEIREQRAPLNPDTSHLKLA